VERAGLKLKVDCPPLSEPVYVDHEMWEKIVLNLISNAFKFTFEGEIEVLLRQTDGAVEFAVRDTGTGIPAHELPHLFERFHRVKAARGRTYEGSGIGLALVQELVKLHGGVLRVESEEDHGSSFRKSIPLGTSHLPADRIGAKRNTQSTATRAEAFVQEASRWLPGGENEILLSPELQGPSEIAFHDTSSYASHRPRVLIADDNADIREYLQRLLGHSYEVTAVADGSAALQSVREHMPDLVLTDVMMPRRDGFAFLRELRADTRTREVSVILLFRTRRRRIAHRGTRGGCRRLPSKTI
jgi:CheY-like chemotaxis protein